MPRISYSFKTFLRIKKKAIHHIYFQSCNYKHESFNIQIEWKQLPPSSHPNIRFLWNSLKGVHLTCTDSYVVIHKLLIGFSWKTDKSLTHYGAKNDLELLFLLPQSRIPVLNSRPETPYWYFPSSLLLSLSSPFSRKGTDLAVLELTLDPEWESTWPCLLNTVIKGVCYHKHAVLLS